MRVLTGELPAIASTEFVPLRANHEVDRRYLAYVLKSEHVRQELNSRVQSVTRSHQRVDPNDVLNLSVPVPSLDQQRAIVRLLDSETKKVDDIAAARSAQVELYRERVASELVLKFLAGGDRSESTMPLGRLFSDVRGGIWGDDPVGSSSDVHCVRVADFDRTRMLSFSGCETRRHVLPRQYRANALREGDVLLEKSGGGDKSPVGFAVSYSRVPSGRAICSNFVARLRPAPAFDPRYVALVLGALYRAGWNVSFIKQTTGIQNLDVPAYMRLQVAVPVERAAQRVVAEKADRSLERCEAFSTSVEQQIVLLREKVQAIVTSVVTGQIEASTARGVNL